MTFECDGLDLGGLAAQAREQIARQPLGRHRGMKRAHIVCHSGVCMKSSRHQAKIHPPTQETHRHRGGAPALTAAADAQP